MLYCGSSAICLGYADKIKFLSWMQFGGMISQKAERVVKKVILRCFLVTIMIRKEELWIIMEEHQKKTQHAIVKLLESRAHGAWISKVRCHELDHVGQKLIDEH